jgi:predicted  nucleic acid-binding Zn-ribbon protein
MTDTEANQPRPLAAASAPPVIDHDPPPPPPPARPVRRGGTPFVVTLLFTAALAGGLYYVWKHPQGSDDEALKSAIAAQQDQLKSDLQVQIQALKDAAAPLHDQMAALSDRVEKLEKAPPPPPASPPEAPSGDLAALGQRVDQLSAKLDALAARPDAAPQPAAPPPAAPDQAAAEAAANAAADARAQLAALSSKLDQLEQAQKAGLAQSADQRTALDQTASQQKAALDALNDRLAKLEQGTGKIESEADMAARAARVDALQATLAAGKPLGDIEGAPPALARFAKTPPPTDAALRSEFPAVADEARAVSEPQVAKESFWTRVLARMQQTIVVRRGDNVIVGDPAAGILARATDAVDRDDLPGAVQALGALQGPAAEAVSGWVTKVRSLLDARAALIAMAATPKAPVQ